MPGLVPAIHETQIQAVSTSWMPGTRPGMTDGRLDIGMNLGPRGGRCCRHQRLLNDIPAIVRSSGISNRRRAVDGRPTLERRPSRCRLIIQFITPWRGGACPAAGCACGRGRVLSPLSSAARSRPVQSADDRSPDPNVANIRQSATRAGCRDAVAKSSLGSRIRGRRRDHAAPIAESAPPECAAPALALVFRDRAMPAEPR